MWAASFAHGRSLPGSYAPAGAPPVAAVTLILRSGASFAISGSCTLPAGRAGQLC